AREREVAEAHRAGDEEVAQPLLEDHRAGLREDFEAGSGMAESDGATAGRASSAHAIHGPSCESETSSGAGTPSRNSVGGRRPSGPGRQTISRRAAATPSSSAAAMRAPIRTAAEVREWTASS